MHLVYAPAGGEPRILSVPVRKIDAPHPSEDAAVRLRSRALRDFADDHVHARHLAIEIWSTDAALRSYLDAFPAC